MYNTYYGLDLFRKLFGSHGIPSLLIVFIDLSHYNKG